MRLITLVLAAACAAPDRGAAQNTSIATRGLRVIVSTGTGSVTLKPDRGALTVAVVTRATSAAEAGRLNATTMVRVIAALKRQKLADSTVVTTGYAVYLDRGDGQPRPTGAAPTYAARNELRVSVTDLDAVGRLADTALAAGATEIANVTFASSQESAARQRAIGFAVRAARADAEAAATAAGGVVGELLELSLTPEYASFAYALSVSSGNAGPYSPVMPRDVVVRASATTRYVFVARP
jgi:uncharacterized protein YggE